MDYKRIYDNLISSRKLLNRNKKDGNYYEKHHIVPVSLGGNNDKENLILLTAKEHLFAHLLLVHIHTGVNKYKMSAAVWLMCNSRKQSKRISSCREYEYIKLIWREAKIGTKLSQNSITQRTATRMSKGHYSPNTIGKVWVVTEDTKIKMRTARAKQIMPKGENAYRHNTCWITNGTENKTIDKSELKNYLSQGWEQGRVGLNSTFSRQAIENSALKRQRIILQYDLEHNFIQEWPSIKIASNELQLTSISDCCAGRQKRAGQFIFKYK